VDQEKQRDSEYVVLFGGVRLSRAQLNRLGFGLIFGFVGLLISIGIIGRDNILPSLVVALIFAFIGYFALSKKRYRK
jgi:hypothetical protein